MNLPILSTGPQARMTSLEIAELVQSRHDSVKRTIERLATSGAIQLPPLVEVNNNQSLSPNSKTVVYVFEGEHGKRDSFVVVAQLSPLFTAKLVDRWIELERSAHPVVALPNFTDPAAAAIAWAAEYQAKQAAMLERDEAIRTKAQIGSRREATAMATAAKATREAAKMAELVGRAVNHACVLAVQAATGAKYAWHPLKAHCVTHNLPILRVHSEAYGEVNSYPASAWLEVYGVDLSQLWGVAA